MSKNEGNADRFIRVVLGVALMWIGFGGIVTGTAGTVLGVVGLLPLFTGLVGWCPLYSIVGLSTKKGERSAAASR